MLIPSHRHRSEDLALWEEMESADRAHGNSTGLARKIERSLDVIREFAADGPCYASVSWGKDSVTLSHLVWLSREPIFLWHVRGRAALNPYQDQVRDAFLSRFDVIYGEIQATYSDADGGYAMSRWCKPAGSRYLSGIRADESSGRKIRMRKWGLASTNACAPLGWWTSADVFGHCALHDLPMHPNYAMLGGGRWDRSRLRVDALTGDGGTQFGRCSWEREYYGDVLRRREAARATPPGVPP